MNRRSWSTRAAIVAASVVVLSGVASVSAQRADDAQTLSKPLGESVRGQPGGSVVVWGDNTDGRCDVPSPDTGFMVIAAGYQIGLAIRAAAPAIGTGDLNCGGAVVIFDIQPSTAALLDPAEYIIMCPDCGMSLADVTGDGAVDVLDINRFVDPLLGTPESA